MIPHEPFAARSDVGLVRTGNEDRYLALPPVFAVADGMGGHKAGEVAATIAVELLEAAASDPTAPDGAALVDVLERSNSAIRTQAHERPGFQGMGTTCTVAVFAGGVVEIAHVGDSRAYLLRADVLRRLTEDHSLVASLVREGLLGADEASTDGRRNIITRALGAEDDVLVDRIAAALEPGDRLLLCTDGLSGKVPDATISAVLASEPDPARAADRLVELANAAGGDDNVTVVVIDPDRLPVPAAAAPADVPSERLRPRSGPRPTSVVLIGVLAVAVVLAALGAIRGGTGPGAAPAPSPTPTAAAPTPSLPPASSAPSPSTPVPTVPSTSGSPPTRSPAP